MKGQGKDGLARTPRQVSVPLCTLRGVKSETYAQL